MKMVPPYALAALLLLLPGARGSAAHDAPPPTEIDKTKDSPYPEQDFPNRVFFGDAHLHTAFSARAGMIGIALSAIVLGALVLAEVRPPLWLAALVVAAFAVFHGHSHGRELPEGTSALIYSLGFVIATGLLHAIGVQLGVAHRWKTGRRLVQAAGGGVALAGVFFL